MEKLEPIYIAGKNVKWLGALENNLAVPQMLNTATIQLKNSSPMHLPKRNENIYPYKVLHMVVYNRFIKDKEKSRWVSVHKYKKSKCCWYSGTMHYIQYGWTSNTYWCKEVSHKKRLYHDSTYINTESAHLEGYLIATCAGSRTCTHTTNENTAFLREMEIFQIEIISASLCKFTKNCWIVKLKSMPVRVHTLHLNKVY